MSTTTSWEIVRDESLTAMTPTERAEYYAAAIEAEARLQLAELSTTHVALGFRSVETM